MLPNPKPRSIGFAHNLGCVLQRLAGVDPGSVSAAEERNQAAAGRMTLHLYLHGRVAKVRQHDVRLAVVIKGEGWNEAFNAMPAGELRRRRRSRECGPEDANGQESSHTLHIGEFRPSLIPA